MRDSSQYRLLSRKAQSIILRDYTLYYTWLDRRVIQNRSGVEKILKSGYSVICGLRMSLEIEWCIYLVRFFGTVVVGYLHYNYHDLILEVGVFTWKLDLEGDGNLQFLSWRLKLRSLNIILTFRCAGLYALAKEKFELQGDWISNHNTTHFRCDEAS